MSELKTFTTFKEADAAKGPGQRIVASVEQARVVDGETVRVRFRDGVVTYYLMPAGVGDYLEFTEWKAGQA